MTTSQEEPTKEIKAAKPKAPAKPRAATVAKKTVKSEEAETVVDVAPKKQEKAPVIIPTIDLPAGRYIFATGRRKTAVVNIRLFAGTSENIVNKRPIAAYFEPFLISKSVEPLNISGLASSFYFTAQAAGGGKIAQAQATAHALAQALASTSEDLSKILKKNGFLTRDSRAKERKKPGLRGARRSPQWAKR